MNNTDVFGDFFLSAGGGTLGNILLVVLYLLRKYVRSLRQDRRPVYTERNKRRSMDSEHDSTDEND